jgi:general secretion pathway protein E
LLKEGRISQRDANLVATTPRTRDKLHWHPLQMIAQFEFADAKNPSIKLTIDVLSAWLAHKAEQPLFHIDPLKINAGIVTAVMSYAFAERHGILAVQVERRSHYCQFTALSY